MNKITFSPPEGWRNLSDCFRCKYFLACYYPIRRMCPQAEAFLIGKMREEYDGPEIDDWNEDWGGNNADLSNLDA